MDYVRKIKYGKLHNGNVQSLKYFKENDTILSCSKDSNASIVKKVVGRKRRPFVFKFNRVNTAKMNICISGREIYFRVLLHLQLA